jgi:hypothetical protein
MLLKHCCFSIAVTKQLTGLCAPCFLSEVFTPQTDLRACFSVKTLLWFHLSINNPSDHARWRYLTVLWPFVESSFTTFQHGPAQEETAGFCIQAYILLPYLLFYFIFLKRTHVYSCVMGWGACNFYSALRRIMSSSYSKQLLPLLGLWVESVVIEGIKERTGDDDEGRRHIVSTIPNIPSSLPKP